MLFGGGEDVDRAMENPRSGLRDRLCIALCALCLLCAAFTAAGQEVVRVGVYDNPPKVILRESGRRGLLPRSGEHNRRAGRMADSVRRRFVDRVSGSIGGRGDRRVGRCGDYRRTSRPLLVQSRDGARQLGRGLRRDGPVDSQPHRSRGTTGCGDGWKRPHGWSWRDCRTDRTIWDLVHLSSLRRLRRGLRRHRDRRVRRRGS